MNRKEEINKEIESLENKIINLRNEYDTLIRNEKPVNVGDIFRELRKITSIYSKVVKLLDNGLISIIRVTNTSISRNIISYNKLMYGIVDKCT